jgi:hypothetical protein
MRKIKPLLCVMALTAAAALAVSINAQKQSDAGDAQAKGAGDATRDATAQHDASAHPDCPMMSESKPHPDCPMMGGDKSSADAGGHAANLAAVNARGEKAMGFSQTETTHHFILEPDGGIIQVEANDAKDSQNREHVRQHLAHVARAFAEGDFGAPVLVHDRVPPGAPAMRRLKSEISYAYEETERGARVRITTKSAEALAAIHDFLRFQITDHQTGDSLEVK